MKHLVLFLFFFFVAVQGLFAQADAGADKTISGNKGTTIGKPGNSNWCYHWEATPSDPNLQKDVAQPQVKPSQTTTYKLTVTGPEFSFVSTDEVTVFKFGIKYLRHSVGKEWKAVVGEPIEFSAEADASCTDWDWDMEDGFPDTWNPVGGNVQTGTMTIPYSDLSKASNSWFGDRYGTVGVSCKDAEGNVHEILSTDMVPAQKVKVFFDPDKNVDGGVPSNAKPPCWFIFWKDGGVVEDINLCSYSHEPGLFGYWSALTGMVLCPLAGDVNSGPETLLDLSGNPFTMTGSGRHIDCVAETITHELNHRDIDDAWGGIGAVRAEHADTDGLPDSEENSPSESFYHVSLPNDPDSYNYNYAPAGAYDYSDNEVRCRIIEIKKKKMTYPLKDWSKDIYNPLW